MPFHGLQSVQAATSAVLVKDIVDGPDSSFPRTFLAVGDQLFFSAFTPELGYELWRTDGTSAGTRLVKDINPGDYGSRIQMVGALNNLLIFVVGDVESNEYSTLWRSDGTEEGTFELADTGVIDTLDSEVLNGVFYVSGVRTTESAEDNSNLWRTDGTVEGTEPIAFAGSTEQNVADLALFDGDLFVAAWGLSEEDSTLSWLYRTDGTAADFSEVVAFTNPTLINALTPSGGKLFFRGGNQRSELWVSNGTSAGTTNIDFLPAGVTSSFIPELVDLNGILLFSSSSTNDGDIELWRTDGTVANTSRVKDICPGSCSSAPTDLVLLNGIVYFSANNGNGGREPWRSDGTAAGTFLLANTTANDNAVIGGFTLVDGKIYFVAGPNQSNDNALWVTDGTAANTSKVFDLNANGADAISALTAFNGTLFFVGTNGSTGIELWKLGEGELPDERVSDGLLAFYDFEEGSGNTIRDTSGVGTALNLRVARSFTHQWVEGGLRLKGLTVLRTNGAASKIIQAAKANNALTIEAWITPADVEQFSSRIITVSPNTTVRNFTLNQGSFTRQESSEALFRLRSTGTKNDGQEWTSGAGALDSELVHLVVTVASDGQVRMYVDGEVVRSSNYAGTLSNWNTSYPLLLGNEALGGRGWKGTYYLVAFYDRALSAEEVQQNFNVGP
jgi:ELWxxDGT repeat protein